MPKVTQVAWTKSGQPGNIPRSAIKEAGVWATIAASGLYQGLEATGFKQVIYRGTAAVVATRNLAPALSLNPKTWNVGIDEILLGGMVHNGTVITFLNVVPVLVGYNSMCGITWLDHITQLFARLPQLPSMVTTYEDLLEPRTLGEVLADPSKEIGNMMNYPMLSAYKYSYGRDIFESGYVETLAISAVEYWVRMGVSIGIHHGRKRMPTLWGRMTAESWDEISNQFWNAGASETSPIGLIIAKYFPNWFPDHGIVRKVMMDIAVWSWSTLLYAGQRSLVGSLGRIDIVRFLSQPLLHTLLELVFKLLLRPLSPAGTDAWVENLVMIYLKLREATAGWLVCGVKKLGNLIAATALYQSIGEAAWGALELVQSGAGYLRDLAISWLPAISPRIIFIAQPFLAYAVQIYLYRNEKKIEYGLGWLGINAALGIVFNIVFSLDPILSAGWLLSSAIPIALTNPQFFRNPFAGTKKIGEAEKFTGFGAPLTDIALKALCPFRWWLQLEEWKTAVDPTTKKRRVVGRNFSETELEDYNTLVLAPVETWIWKNVSYIATVFRDIKTSIIHAKPSSTEAAYALDGNYAIAAEMLTAAFRTLELLFSSTGEQKNNPEWDALVMIQGINAEMERETEFKLPKAGKNLTPSDENKTIEYGCIVAVMCLQGMVADLTRKFFDWTGKIAKMPFYSSSADPLRRIVLQTKILLQADMWGFSTIELKKSLEIVNTSYFARKQREDVISVFKTVMQTRSPVEDSTLVPGIQEWIEMSMVPEVVAHPTPTPPKVDTWLDLASVTNSAHSDNMTKTVSQIADFAARFPKQGTVDEREVLASILRTYVTVSEIWDKNPLQIIKVPAVGKERKDKYTAFNHITAALIPTLTPVQISIVGSILTALEAILSQQTQYEAIDSDKLLTVGETWNSCKPFIRFYLETTRWGDNFEKIPENWRRFHQGEVIVEREDKDAPKKQQRGQTKQRARDKESTG